ncbi:MAG: hypothetical protein QW292_05990 [Candidatus Parvarchaeota archaeon]
MPINIRKKLPLQRKTEETLKINMHNLRQYNYLKHTNPDLIKDYGEILANNIVPKPQAPTNLNKGNRYYF